VAASVRGHESGKEIKRRAHASDFAGRRPVLIGWLPSGGVEGVGRGRLCRPDSSSVTSAWS
jgi:hypothetical protein